MAAANSLPPVLPPAIDANHLPPIPPLPATFFAQPPHPLPDAIGNESTPAQVGIACEIFHNVLGKRSRGELTAEDVNEARAYKEKVISRLPDVMDTAPAWATAMIQQMNRNVTALTQQMNRNTTILTQIDNRLNQTQRDINRALSVERTRNSTSSCYVYFYGEGIPHVDELDDLPNPMQKDEFLQLTVPQLNTILNHY